MKNYKDLKGFAEAFGFYATSTTGGKHNAGSKHFLGQAIDVRTRDKSSEECDSFIRKARALGVIVRDERERPVRQKIWSGAHIHLEIGAETEAAVRKFQYENN